eukprot:scaffold199337_cov45-Prasinocladus_malaysianus.AAC.3
MDLAQLTSFGALLISSLHAAILIAKQRAIPIRSCFMVVAMYCYYSGSELVIIAAGNGVRPDGKAR